MRQKLVLFFLYLLAVTGPGFSQPSQSAVIDKINTKDLTNTFVSTLFQDQKGYLWVGTIAGLNRYNGYDFTKFRSFEKDTTSLSNPAITCIAQLDADKIMVGTRNGLSIYSYSTNNFTRVRLAPSVADGKKKKNIYSIIANSKGEKLVGTADGLLIYNSQKNLLEPIPFGKRTFLEGWIIQSLCFDRLGNLWACAKRMGADGNLFSRVFKCNINKRSATEITVYTGGSAGHVGISEDYLGNIWVGVEDGLVNINPSTFVQTYYKAPNDFYSNISYTHTKDNMIWQCFWSFGLTSFDIDKKEFKVYKNDPDNEKTLMSNKCWALFKDENDILWIGSDIGLQKLTSSRPNMDVIKRNYQNPTNSFLANRISAVLPSKYHNNICFAGIDGEGFSVYDRLNKIAINFGPNAYNKNNERFVNDFLEDEKGNVYVAGQHHFHKISFTGNTPWVKSYLNQQEHYSSCIVPDPVNKNICWIGGIGELFSFNKATEQFEFFKQPGINGVIHSGFTFKNKLYFTHFNGLFSFNPVTKKTDPIPLTDVGNITNALVLNDSTVLLSSQYLGLIKFFPESRRKEIIYKNNDQLYPEITEIVYYKNSVWLATVHGLVKLNPLTNEQTEITTDDGLPSETVHQLNVLEGYLYIATQDGLVIFNPDFQVSHFNIPKIEVTKIIGTGNNFLQENINNNSEITLEENQNSFQVNFTLFDFTMPEKNTYKFRMVPLDKEWKSIGNRHSVFFNDLLPGTYVFELMGATADNTWCAEPFKVTIKIVPPFYKSKWFYYLSITVVLLISVIFILLRFRSNQRKQKRLEEIIQQRTAEIQEKRAELLDSISYAERIQKAIFVGEDILHGSIPKSFILYKPKDKVSGDFYWIGKYKDLLIVFAGDCTGHGVPGAMLSIVGTSLLNKIVYEENIFMPGEILTRLNYLFYNQLSLKETNIRDGMDASILTVNLSNHT
ncbi:MAG: hypothetical protein K0S12_1469, partial [Bacteroidetes bacterium]|nr:hypothetical protein [Bacteroidota bacterium]